MKVAVVAAGAMGSALGARLVEHGAEVMTSLAGRSQASAERARAAGMRAVTDEQLMEAAIFLSVVPPGEARAAAERFAPHLARAGAKPVYVDCNAVNPATARAIAASIAPTGAEFVDAGIIGLPPRPGTAGPAIYCCGRAAPVVLALSGYGLRMRPVAGETGAASALKMSYAGITKGLAAVASAMVLGAARAAAGDALLAELAESQPQLLEVLRRMVPGMSSKAWRWVAEMEEIAGFLAEVPGGGALYQAVAELYRHIAADYPGGPDTGALDDFFASNGRPRP